MKLAILLSDISKIGGVQRVTTALVNELCQNIDVTIISIFSENELPAFGLSDRVQVSYLLKEHVNLKKNFFKVSGALRKVLKEQQFDVVLSSGTGLVSFLWFASLGIPIRLLAWEHQCFYFGRSFGLEWLGRKLACRFAESIVVLTKKDEGFYKENRPKAHIEQIYNILDMDSQTAKCQLSSKKIISVGSLGRQKGFDLALEVASQIQLSYPDWQWDIYGDGPDREKLEEKVREYQLEGFINLKGLVQNVRELYPDYSIYAMTSRHEGLPTVLLEAKNCQMPVISFDCNCGPSDIISDGRNGFLIDCFDVNIYAKTLSKLMTSLELREQVAKSSVIPAEELSTTYILNKWNNLLKKEDNMKIVHVEDFFHPDAGYQINVLPKYLAKFGHEQVIITSEMDKIPDNLTQFFGRENIEERDRSYEEKYHVKIIRLPLHGFVSGRAIFSRKLISTIKGLSPDVLYIHGNDTLTGIRLLLARKKLNCRIVTDSHMLEMASKNPFNTYFRRFYKTLITPILIKEQIPIIRTQDDDYVEKHLGIPLSQAPWISYGSDTAFFHADSQIKEDFRSQYQIASDALICVYAGKLDEHKGGMFLAESLSKKLNTEQPIVFIIVGNTNGEYGEAVEKSFSQSENQILRFPTQKYQKLAQFFQVADFALFPKQCSLSFYDAQACGLPVLLEDNNINLDRTSHYNGWTFKANSKLSLRDSLKMIASLDEEKRQEYSQNALHYILEHYNYEDKAREYEKILIGECTK